MGNELKATRTKGKLKPKTGFEYKRLETPKSNITIKTESVGDVSAVNPEGNPIRRKKENKPTKSGMTKMAKSAAATKAKTGFEHKHLKTPKSTIKLKQEPLGDVVTPFKLRGGTGKIDSYGAFQRQGLISPMQVEDPPKKKGKSIMDMSNAQIYRMNAEGKFGGEGNQSMKLLLNSPRGGEFSKFKTARDKEVFRKTDAIAKEKYRNEDAPDETDQQKAYGEDNSFKKQTQQAGKVFDAKGDTIYPGMKGHTEAYLKTKAEGHGVSKDVLVKRL